MHMRNQLLVRSHPGQLAPAIPLGVDVVELEDRKQRQLSELRSHINQLLYCGWQIVTRHPLTLQKGRQACYVLHGMLISDSLI
ncbi:MAG: hypothetical protein ACJAXR_002629 [Halopseudomonas sp.]|jgi:hypothetical protein